MRQRGSSFGVPMAPPLGASLQAAPRTRPPQARRLAGGLPAAADRPLQGLAATSPAPLPRRCRGGHADPHGQGRRPPLA
eukprot:8092552-Alexandrium_andersonii.AAC.1